MKMIRIIFTMQEIHGISYLIFAMWQDYISKTHSKIHELYRFCFSDPVHWSGNQPYGGKLCSDLGK